MNTEDTNTVDIEDEVSQADFEKEFFGTTATQIEEEETVNETEDDHLAPDENEDEAEEQDEDDEDSEEEEEIEEVPQIKQKRNKTQERIEKLVADARQAERERDALRIELERIRASEVKAEEKTPTIVQEPLDTAAPSPDAVDEKGEPLYELGEFDPKFIRDLTKFTIAQETKAAKEAAEREAQEAQMRAAQQEISNKWAERVEAAEAELPDLRERLATMGQTFNNIEPNYGEYLASTIMASEVGPEIMYYLSQNIGEAQKIVASGPVAATLAIGRLEAKLTKEPEQKRNTKQVSKAPDPPEPIEQARGRGGRYVVAPDTDDQAAFEREFFK